MERPTDIVLRRVIDETASSEEAQSVATWFATEEGQAWLAEQMDRDAELIAEGTIPRYGDIPSELLLARINRTTDRVNRRRMLFRIAAVLIPCGLIIGVWANLNGRLGGALFSSPQTEQIVAAVGERKEIIFQDGTKVFLNAGTQISYPQFFGLKERRVVLNGEAYFEVAHNPQRPFMVQVGQAAIRVLGTSFNVKAYDYEPQIDLVLINGSVEFSCGNSLYKLTPMQKLVYDKTSGEGIIASASYAGREAEWRKKIINFRDTPMKEAITILERWYDVKFKVSDEQLYQCTFTLRTEEIPLRELLTELENIAPIRFEINQKNILVHHKK